MALTNLCKLSASEDDNNIILHIDMPQEMKKDIKVILWNFLWDTQRKDGNPLYLANIFTIINDDRGDVSEKPKIEGCPGLS